MASLAVLLKERGHRVTGSDENTYPPMSDFLRENSIEVATPYASGNLQPHPDYVVLGNALSRGNPEVEYALEAHLHYLSMAELLKNEFIRGNTSIVISGTHGKTTTTSLAAHVFHSCGEETGFMIGGIPENFGSSCKDVKKGGYFITEGDEYDTSLFDKRSKFFHYLPDRLVINNIEFDHADIFQDLDEIKRSFTLMLRQIPRNGLIIANGDDPDAVQVAANGFSPVVTFGLGDRCDCVISDVNPLEGELGMRFAMNWNGGRTEWRIPLLGEFNVRNAAAVILLGMHEGLDVKKIRKALDQFTNVKRRLQKLTGNRKVSVFDDFAHHPTAIRQTLNAVKTAWPRSRIHAIYEARSNTSVRAVHQEKMAMAFESADTVTFYKLHREERLDPGDRLDLESIVLELRERDKTAQKYRTHDEILEFCLNSASENDIFVIMSNGAFGGLPQRLAAELDTLWMS